MQQAAQLNGHMSPPIRSHVWVGSSPEPTMWSSRSGVKQRHPAETALSSSEGSCNPKHLTALHAASEPCAQRSYPCAVNLDDLPNYRMLLGWWLRAAQPARKSGPQGMTTAQGCQTVRTTQAQCPGNPQVASCSIAAHKTVEQVLETPYACCDCR